MESLFKIFIPIRSEIHEKSFVMVFATKQFEPNNAALHFILKCSPALEYSTLPVRICKSKDTKAEYCKNLRGTLNSIKTAFCVAAVFENTDLHCVLIYLSIYMSVRLFFFIQLRVLFRA